ncbi:hypothetical protein MKW94_027303 [Papaver nudicaule]|uniref:Uncharacterized protein n=1 Tax=Papaver nudicaule TaxID=74823 RepID=A0AA41VNC7_PAPNU|nr:hypothetical protein [Papaver nudicaule]
MDSQGGKKRGRDQEIRYDTKALLEWTSLEEVENIVLPYATQVRHKAVYDGYKDASEVLAEYKIVNILRKRLIERKDKLSIPTYIDEHFYRHALKIKAQMLRAFSTMLSDPTLQGVHKKWINQLLKKEVDPEQLLQDAEEFIKDLKAIVNTMELDVRNEINEKVAKRLKCLKKIRFNENDFQDTKQEFEFLQT